MVNPRGISPLVPAYSVAIRHGHMVFVSGMTGIKPGTQDIIDGGVAVQTRQTLENIRTVLQAADIAIVPGRPDLDIRHLRCTEYVIATGRLYRTAVLYRAAGLTPGRCGRAGSRE